VTLLESIVAFVLLAVVGVACLDLSHGASSLAVSSREWNAAVARAESALTLASAAQDAGSSNDVGNVRVTRRPWSDDVDEVSVDVPVRDGRVFRLSRLVAHGVPLRSAMAPDALSAGALR
jgi:type II secretory pathway pseudopilin PulG